MGDRLKQIWAGFEATTTRNLTGKGVDNIIVPHHTDYAEEDWQFLPEDFAAPSERAFNALNEGIKSSKKRFGRKQSAAPSTPEQPQPMAERAFNGDELVKGLRATAMRTERSYLDYERFLSSDAGKSVLKKTKKKRFGIF